MEISEAACELVPGRTVVGVNYIGGYGCQRLVRSHRLLQDYHAEQLVEIGGTGIDGAFRD